MLPDGPPSAAVAGLSAVAEPAEPGPHRETGCCGCCCGGRDERGPVSMRRREVERRLAGEAAGARASAVAACAQRRLGLTGLRVILLTLP